MTTPLSKLRNPERLQEFCQTYATELTEARMNHPEEYVWPVGQLPTVIAKMQNAIKEGTFNKDGVAIKTTCQKLGIKYTYAAINEYLNGK